ncbi:DUF2516 family protein [Nocardioides pacificus]
MNIFAFESAVMLVVLLLLLVVKGFAFINAMTFPAEAYAAAGKLTKPAWLIILGLGLAFELLMFQPIGLIGIAFTIAALVYLADVRPALAGLRRR